MGGMLMTTPAAPSHAKDEALTIDACALLDAQAIQKVLGVPVEKGDRRDSGLESNGAYSSACVWMLTADRGRPADPRAPLGGKRFVILNALRWPPGSEGARTYLQAFREASDSGVLPSKPGARDFGDEALWWGDGLAVRRGEVSFGVSVFIPRDAAQSTSRVGEREERLARIVLSRLAAHDRRKPVSQ
jgi:hypothetical protein